MRSSAAARRYARALFGLARSDGRVTQVREELAQIAELFEQSAELREALLTPLHPAEERKAVLRAVMERGQLSRTVQNFFSYLIDRRRLVDFQATRAEYDRMADEISGLVTAEVIAASALDARRQDRLRRALSERMGREVKLEVVVDPDLIGGAVAKVGDLVFDGSLRTQLAQLRANLTKGA
jgi:F-type H+-transporting ATPase subunit delta